MCQFSLIKIRTVPRLQEAEHRSDHVQEWIQSCPAHSTPSISNKHLQLHVPTLHPHPNGAMSDVSKYRWNKSYDQIPFQLPAADPFINPMQKRVVPLERLPKQRKREKIPTPVIDVEACIPVSILILLLSATGQPFQLGLSREDTNRGHCGLNGENSIMWWNHKMPTHGQAFLCK